MRDNEDQRPLRRLLNHFQQRIGAIAIQVLRGINNNNPPAAEGSRKLKDLQPQPNGRPRFRSRPSSSRAAIRAETGKSRDGRVAKRDAQPNGGLDVETRAPRTAAADASGLASTKRATARRASLCRSLPAADQPGVGEAALAIGGEQLLFGGLVADQRSRMARCGAPGKASASGGRRSRSSSCPAGLERARRIEPRLDRGPDRSGDLAFAPAGVDDSAAPRLGGGDVEEGAAKGLMKGEPLRFEPVGASLALPALRRPLEAVSGARSRISVKSAGSRDCQRSRPAMKSGGRFPATP